MPIGSSRKKIWKQDLSLRLCWTASFIRSVLASTATYCQLIHQDEMEINGKLKGQLHMVPLWCFPSVLLSLFLSEEKGGKM